MEAKCKVEWSSQRESTAKTCGSRFILCKEQTNAMQRRKQQNINGSKNIGKTSTKYRIRDDVLKISAQNSTVRVSDVRNHKQD